MVSEPVDTLQESHTHEVRPGGTSADREAEMDQRQFLTSSGTTLCTILQPKVNSGLPRGLLQASTAAGSSSRRETVHSEPFQDTSRPYLTCDPSDISHLDTHTPTTQSRAVSVTSGLADSDFHAALAKSQTGITELKDIVVKKFGDEKPDDPRLGFCDFLKVVQLTSD